MSGLFKNYRCCYRTSFKYLNVHLCVNGGCIFTHTNTNANNHNIHIYDSDFIVVVVTVAVATWFLCISTGILYFRNTQNEPYIKHKKAITKKKYIFFVFFFFFFSSLLYNARVVRVNVLCECMLYSLGGCN